MVLTIAAILVFCWSVSAGTNITLGFVSNYCAMKDAVFNRSYTTNVTRLYDPDIVDMDGNSGWTYYSELAVLAAVDHINNDPSILPGVHVNVKRFTDCGEYYPDADYGYYGKSGGYASAVTATDIVDEHRDVLGVIGSQYSSTVKGIAQILSTAQIPYCAATTASLRFTNKIMYPYMWRTTSYSVSESILAFFNYFNVRRVAIIYQRDDEFGDSDFRRMSQVAALHQLDIVSSVGLLSNYDAQAVHMLNKTLHRSDARYILVLGQSHFVTSVVGYRNSMFLADPNYVWFANNAFIFGPQSNEADFNGAILVNHCNDATSLKKGDVLRRLMNQDVGADFSTTYFYRMGIHLLYDCAILMLVGFNELQIDPETLSNRLAQDRMNFTLFRNLDYPGIVTASEVRLDDQGDAKSPVCFYLVTKDGDTGEFARTDESRASIVSFNTSIPIFSGSFAIPSDGFVELHSYRYSLRTNEGVAIACLSVIGILTSSAGAWFLYKFQKASIIRASCLPEMLAICFGTMCAYASLLLFMETPTSASCRARITLLLVGYSAIMIPLASKNLMIQWLFGQETSRTLDEILKAKAAYRACAWVAGIVHVGVCALALMQFKIVSLASVDGNDAYMRCSARGILALPAYVWFISNALVWTGVVVSATLSTKVKLVEYNETTQMVLVALFSGMNFLLIATLETAPDKLTDLKTCLILWTTITAVLGTMLGGRVADVMKGYGRKKRDNGTSADSSSNKKSAKQSQISLNRQKTLQFYSFRVLDKAGKLCVFKIQKRGLCLMSEKWMRGVVSLHSLGGRRWICITTLQKAYCAVISDVSAVSATSSSVEIGGAVRILFDFKDSVAAHLFMRDIENAFTETDAAPECPCLPDIVVNQ
ncbi:periplasmic binding protein-like I [Chytriomyces cf. hyalinus JEL632]|nr:periplasmic binding protein-like I [Chytriomyces cf. hyalinus JEL632]